MARTRTRTTTLLVLTWTLLSGAASHGQAPLPPPFPRANATRLLETDRVVIWNIVWPKGEPTALHRHVYDQVGTYYARGGRTITTPDGAARQAMTEVGSLSTTRKGTTHIEEGNTDPPLRAVFIELKQETPSGRTPLSGGEPGMVSRPGATQRSDDERVRVWDVVPPAGATERAYRTANDTVLVYLSGGRLRVTGEDGVARELRVEPGTMRYVPRGTHEREAPLEGTPRAIVFEIK